MGVFDDIDFAVVCIDGQAQLIRRTDRHHAMITARTTTLALDGQHSSRGGLNGSMPRGGWLDSVLGRIGQEHLPLLF